MEYFFLGIICGLLVMMYSEIRKIRLQSVKDYSQRTDMYIKMEKIRDEIESLKNVQYPPEKRHIR